MKKYSVFVLLLVNLYNVNTLKAEDITVPKDSVKMSYVGNEVVIEAFKSNNNLSQVPISASLISGQDLDNQNVVDIKELSGYVPNFFAPDYGSKMTSPSYIRGIGSRINAPSVGLYVDGVPYFDRSTFDIDMMDIDRIEVLRGPQGTIYGRNTMGGIINVYTKSPLKYNETNLRLGVGNYDNYTASGSHYGNLNDVLGYSIAGSVMHSGGYFTNEYTGKKADPMDAATGRIRLSWKLMPRLYMHLTSAYEYSDQGGYPYGIYNSADNTVKNVNYNEPSSYRRNMSTNGLNVEYTTDKFKLGSMSSFQFYDGKQLIDQDFTNKDLYFVDFYQLQRMYSEEINIKSNTKSNYQWQFGTFGFYQDYGTNYNIDYRAGTPKISAGTHTIQNAETPTRGAAFYHQSVFNHLLDSGLSLTLGLRYDWEEARMHTIINNQLPDNTIKAVMDAREKDHYSQWTPKAALQYTFDNNNIAYFSVSKGFKAGGFNTTAEDPADRPFKSETSWSYEVGSKASFFDKFLQTDFSLFYIDWDNQQVSQVKTQGYIVRNAGHSVSQGMDATVQLNVLRNLNFQLGYGYTYATFKEYMYDPVKKIDYAGNYLPMVPRNTFSAAGNYTIGLKNSFLQKIILNAQYTGLGTIYWNEDNKSSQPFYSIVNAKASFEMKRISLDLWAKNIGGTDYISYYFSSMGNIFAQAGKPFTCGADFRWKF